MKLQTVLLALVALFAVAATLALADETTDDLLQQATMASQEGEHEKAVGLLTEVIQRDPKLAVAWYLRGRANFCAGRAKESAADFDKYVALEPQSESRQWERGISHYYAGEYAKGAKQFELYQTYHDQDVENSAWRYLCVARDKNGGVKKAQANMLPIENDARVPMMQIYDLYRGKLKPEDVLKAAEEGSANPENKNRGLFYAHLYVGLWHEANGRPDEARTHILAAEKHKIGHYMWDVAHVHAERLRAENEPKAEKK
jgi:lipoprotein NlpI